MKKILVILFYFVVLNTNAQGLKRFEHTHYIANKGERVLYDTAMVMKMSEVRDNFLRDQAKNRKIDSLQNIITSFRNVDATQTIMAPKDKYLERVIRIEATVDRIEKKSPHWTMNPLLWLGVGMGIGLYLIDPPNN